MSSNIFVQIGLQEACELAEITKAPQSFESKDSLAADIWTLPKEVLDRIGTKYVVSVDIHPKSIEYCQNNYNRAAFLRRSSSKNGSRQTLPVFS